MGNMDKSLFKHKIYETVRFHEVDMMGVCNNAVYFNFFEDARIRYVQDIKAGYKLKEILEHGSFFIMAHNECDYIESALLDDELIIHTRVDFLKNTSFGFKHLVENKSTGKIIASGGGVVVHINLKTKTPVQIPDEFYAAVEAFEEKVEILRK